VGPRRVVYTCLFGGYEPLLDQPAAAGSGIDFVAFTDDDTVVSDTWQVRVVPAPFPADQNRSSRRPKILAHEYLPDHDESLYIDNAVELTAPPQQLFADLLPDDVPMALFAHSYRGPVREEFKVVVESRRDADFVCAEQLAHYERVAPGALDGQTLWGGLLLRRHHHHAVCTAMQTWWEHVLRYSRRDQLSLPFALQQTGLPHRVHRLDNRLTRYHVWPREDLVRDPAGGAPADAAAGLRAEASAAARRADRADAEADAARRELTSTVERLQAAQKRAEDAQERAEQAEKRVDRAEERVERADERAKRAENRAERAEKRAAAAEKSIAAVRASTSWRLTRPLRAVTRLARRVNAARRVGGRGRRAR
jgi:hypothetical protein